MSITHGFGIDVGGSGIKGGEVDLETGALVTERIRVETPQPAKMDAVIDVIAGLVAEAGWTGHVGVTMPSVVQHGVTLTAANLNAPEWIGANAGALMTKRVGQPVTLLNDADAAGIAEMRYGTGRSTSGVVVLLTFGTGIGSAVFTDGILVPNTEFGHLQMDGRDAEDLAAASVKDREGLSYEEWAPRVSRYLRLLEDLIWPDLFIAGGGVSKKADKWLPLLDNRTPVVAAQLRNNAGIVGAALAAHDNLVH
jgi:polyphosphate glucokinase